MLPTTEKFANLKFIFETSWDKQLLASLHYCRVSRDFGTEIAVLESLIAGLGVWKTADRHRKYLTIFSLTRNAEKERTEQHMESLSGEYCKEDVIRPRNILADKSWIGFDLDDTLHEFRRSSGIAIDSGLQKISDYHHINRCVERKYAIIL
ncbi:hypothetical protein WAI453_007183 [Rhynchosporium graminicola]